MRKCANPYSLKFITTKEVNYDQKAKVRRISIILAKEGCQNRQTPESWHFQNARGRGKTRARGSIFQAALGKQFSGTFSKVLRINMSTTALKSPPDSSNTRSCSSADVPRSRMV